MIAMAQSNSTRPQPQEQDKGMGGMMGMMQQCRQHCQQTQQSGERLSESIAEAKQSNDPAKMRAALDQVEKQQSEMQQHMTMCMRSMDKMGNMPGMQGNMGGMKHGDKKSNNKKPIRDYTSRTGNSRRVLRNRRVRR